MRSKWSLEMLWKEALKFNTKSEFMRGNYAAYQAAHRKDLIDQICSHMPKRVDQSGENNPRFIWDKDSIQKEALKFNTRNIFYEKSHGAYKAAKRMKILEEVCSHMESQKLNGEYNPNFRWTKEKIQQFAMKCKSKVEFRNSYPEVYDAAYRNGCLLEVTSHMKRNTIWTKDSIVKIANKYVVRNDFEIHQKNAYAAASRIGILDEVCAHMVYSKGTSQAEKELFSVIQNFYPTARKFRKRKISVPNKPHIFGFDIDIFIPELNRGIEFDGTYHHSVAGLSRSRPHWPLEDIENYHKIKDRYFKKQGISILHISEKLWVSNKQKTIKKCLDFLNKRDK